MFSRLYSRGEREGRSQLEDYLTEVFASLFDRLDEKARRSLLHALIDEKARRPFNLAFQYVGDADLDTQVRLDESGFRKRPDMVLRRGGRDILVIEAKLGAAIAQHVDHDAPPVDGISPKTVSQLKTYSTWIAGRNAGADRWPGAVILLTAWTAPPDGFPSQGAAFESVRTWTDVGTWLERNIRSLDPVCKALGADLVTFLKERQLMNRHFNARDLAAYTLYATSEDALRHTFRKAMEGVAEAHPALGKFQRNDVGNDGDMAVFWGWIYLKRELQYRNSKFYIAVGLCAEPGVGFGEDGVDLTHDEPFFVAYFGDENLKQKPSDRVSALPEGWIEITKGRPALAATKPVRHFPGNPDLRARDLNVWGSEQVGRLAAVIQTGDEPVAGA